MSGRVNIMQPKQIFTNADISGDLTSEAVDISHLKGFSIELDWTTSDCEGTFAVELSNTGNTWNPIPADQLTATAAIEGADGTGTIELTTQMAKVRVTFTNTAGATGTLNGWIGGKAI